MRNLPAKRQRYMRMRIVVLGGLLLAFAGLVLQRAHYWQVTRASELREMAENQYMRDIPLSPKRGTIRDRHGAELAVSVDVDSVAADPVGLRASGASPARVAAELSRLLGVDAQRLTERLASKRRFVWVKRRVTPAEGLAVRQLNLRGVLVTKEAQRFYPNGELAAHLLGFADVDGKGIEGIELALDEQLRGSVERVPAIRDRRGKVVFSEHLLDDRAAAGDEVSLTIDKTIQHFAEQELELAVRTFEARAGSIVVMEPSTGELLAVANYPRFNPNRPGDFPVADRRNRAVTDRFEPGSTVKPFTIAGALARGAIGPHQEIDCEDGQLQVAEYVIHDSHHWDMLTPAQILIHSSNIGTAKIGLALGRPALYQVLRGFGFGQQTDIGLPGETAGILRHYNRWYDMDAATISFGQGMSSTALQLTTAMSAIANGGKLMRPTLVQRVRDARGEVVEETLPRVRRRVIPERVARLTTAMLTGVTGKGGTGEEAAIDGYLVAGKTGTAQKADYVHGGYAQGSWSSSFVGFAPASDARLAIAVVIDEPVIAHQGGVVAAPAFRRVMEKSLRHLGVPTDHQNGSMALHAAVPKKDEQGELPQGDPLLANSDPAQETTLPQLDLAQGQVRVPSLLGMTARAAVHAAHQKGFDVRVHGSGVVVRQEPVSQQGVAPGSVIHVHLAPPNADKNNDAAQSVDGTVLSKLRSPSKSAGEAPALLARVGEQP